MKSILFSIVIFLTSCRLIENDPDFIERRKVPPGEKIIIVNKYDKPIIVKAGIHYSYGLQGEKEVHRKKVLYPGEEFQIWENYKIDLLHYT